MEQVGITQDGKKVVRGSGRLYFQCGLPLSIIFNRLIEHDMIPDWQDLCKELKDNGMTINRIEHLLSEHITDSFGKEVRDIVLKRLKSEIAR